MSAALASLVLMLIGSGCRDPRRAPVVTGKGIIAASVDRSDPASVARGFLKLSALMLEIGREGMRDPERQRQFESAKEELVGLSDVEGIELRYPYARHSKSDQERVKRWAMLVASNWPSLVAHYIEGVRPESLRMVDAISVKPKRAVASTAERVAMVHAENPSESAQLAALKQLAGEARDLRGQPLRPGSPEHAAWLRREAVARGMSPSPGVTIYIALRRVGNEWSITSVTVEPLPPTASSPVATN